VRVAFDDRSKILLVPSPKFSSEQDLAREPALTRSTIVGGRTVYISKEGAIIVSIAALKNPPDAQ
jgi:hypothetical protein